MNVKRRINAVILVMLMLTFCVWQGLTASLEQKLADPAVEANKVSSNKSSLDKETIYFWYTDEALTDYLNSVAFSYMEEHDDIRVVPTCVSSVEYLENIYDATLSQEAYPDLFIATNDCLQKAYLLGIASEITDKTNTVSEENYPKIACSAVTCEGKTIAYPFYYDTALLLYNETYLETMAAAKQEAIAAQQEGEQAQAEIDALLESGGQIDENGNMQAGESDLASSEEADIAENAADEEIMEEDTEEYQPLDVMELGAKALIPRSMDDILNLADEYDAPEGVEAIMKWDVSDIFFNYFFAGNYMQLGGENGDDASIIDLYNENSVECLNVYQSLNQFFSIEAKETSYESVLGEFMEGKTIYTLATTDAIAKLEQAKADGTFAMEYDFAPLPDVSSKLQSKGLSVTNVVAVNGFSQHKNKANDFAAYLVSQTDDGLYQRCQKLSANLHVAHENEKLASVMKIYQNNASLPKLMQTSNFWVQLEVTLTGIWQGDDVATSLQNLQQQMESQMH